MTAVMAEARGRALQGLSSSKSLTHFTESVAMRLHQLAVVWGSCAASCCCILQSVCLVLQLT